MHVHLESGNSSILMTVPHDGGVKIPSAQTREETQRWEREGGQDPRDVGTLEIARACRAELGRFGIVPSVLSFDLHRSHVDVNRAPNREPCVDGFQEPYESFHAKLNQEVRRLLSRHGSCLLIDIHGYVASPGPETYDVVIGSDSHRTCPSGTDKKIAACLKNLHVVFSPDPKNKITARYRGGWIVRHMADSYENQGLEAVQLEFSLRARQETVRVEIASHLADAIRRTINT